MKATYAPFTPKSEIGVRSKKETLARFTFPILFLQELKT
jgi:hypothetical protein